MGYDRIVNRRHASDRLPDARDGLTRIERVILTKLADLQRERGDANVPAPMLYGRVSEVLDLSVAEFQTILARLVRR